MATAISTSISPSPEQRDHGMLTELMSRRRILVDKASQQVLHLTDISDHQLYINQLNAEMSEQKTQMVKKHRITTALLTKVKDPKRIESLMARLESLRRWESSFNENVRRINEEMQWFQESPAFKMARAHILENWVECGSGKWVNKLELAEDEKTTFEELLGEMKQDELNTPTEDSSSLESVSRGDHDPPVTVEGSKRKATSKKKKKKDRSGAKK